VITYVDHLGRLEGKIARVLENGFAMTISATLRKRDKLAAQLTWLANRQILNLPEDRRHDRFTPRKTVARLVLPNGTNVGCRVIDLSQSGAAIGVTPDLRPAVGVVTVGKTQGRVVRHIEDGFAIEFMRLQHPDFVDDNVTSE
jgi:PilZ domain